ASSVFASSAAICNFVNGFFVKNKALILLFPPSANSSIELRSIRKRISNAWFCVNRGATGRWINLSLKFASPACERSMKYCCLSDSYPKTSTSSSSLDNVTRNPIALFNLNDASKVFPSAAIASLKSASLANSTDFDLVVTSLTLSISEASVEVSNHLSPSFAKPNSRTTVIPLRQVDAGTSFAYSQLLIQPINNLRSPVFENVTPA